MNEPLVGTILLAFILILAIIHLGVAIGILARFAPYHDLFRPERGLAAYNIVISFLGLLVGGFGLFAVLTDRGILRRVVAYVSIVLGIFALASLIAALAVNAGAINYVRNRFLSKIDNYVADQDARNVVDKIQTKYTCCGVDTWLDWSNVGLNATAPSVNQTTTTTTVVTATTTSSASTIVVTATTTSSASTIVVTATTTSSASTPVVTVTTTSSASTPVVTVTTTSSTTASTLIVIIPSTTTTTASTTTALLTTFVVVATSSTTTVGTVPVTVINSPTTTTTTFLNLSVKAVQETYINDRSLEKRNAAVNTDLDVQPRANRYKRQTSSSSSYGGFVGLPTTYGVTLPESCCTTDLQATGDLQVLYCISNANNVINSFHTDGCARELSRLAVGQSLGLAVINSILFVLALATVPILLQQFPSEVQIHQPFAYQGPFGAQPAQFANQAIYGIQPNQFALGGYNQVFYPPPGLYNGMNYSM